MEAAGSCEMSVCLSLHSPTPQKASVHGYHLENLIVCLAHTLVCVSLEDQLKVCTSVTVFRVDTQCAYCSCELFVITCSLFLKNWLSKFCLCLVISVLLGPWLVISVLLGPWLVMCLISIEDWSCGMGQCRWVRGSWRFECLYCLRSIWTLWMKAVCFEMLGRSCQTKGWRLQLQFK